MLQQTFIIRRISLTFSSWNEDVLAGLGALMIDSDNFEKNNTSIYVTNGVVSRFFGNFNTNAGLLCRKIGNENKREIWRRVGEFASATREFLVALNGIENWRHFLG
jgi:hypothetical protein